MLQHARQTELSSASSVIHQYQDLITIFNDTFYLAFNTKLIKGADEPLYRPADEHCSFHQIIFAHGYFASALHEIAHWCIAGKARRQLEDFGYWYEPDGRNTAQQQAFEKVEIKPQAIEWAFCIAAKKSFRVSVDNLSGESTDPADFKQAVYRQVTHYLTYGFPPRAQQFIEAIAQYYQTQLPLLPTLFIRESL